MIGNPKNSPDQGRNRSLEQSPEEEKDSILLYIEQLRVLFVNNPELLHQLDIVAEKLKRVSEGVKSIISRMLRSELDRMRASNASSTAAIIAANDGEFCSVA